MSPVKDKVPGNQPNIKSSEKPPTVSRSSIGYSHEPYSRLENSRELLLSQGSLNTLDVQGRNHLDSSRNYSSQPDSSTRPFSSQPDSTTRPFSFQPDSSTRPFTSQPESSNRPFSSKPEASNRPFSSQPEASNRSFSSHSSDPLRTYSSYGPEPNHRTQYSHNSYSQDLDNRENRGVDFQDYTPRCSRHAAALRLTDTKIQELGSREDTVEVPMVNLNHFNSMPTLRSFTDSLDKVPPPYPPPPPVHYRSNGKLGNNDAQCSTTGLYGMSGFANSFTNIHNTSYGGFANKSQYLRQTQEELEMHTCQERFGERASDEQYSSNPTSPSIYQTKHRHHRTSHRKLSVSSIDLEKNVSALFHRDTLIARL
ncbi:uncharacterized protein LOC111696848 isoform X2 [Eurytemora carolleeae]|uniref:uncharacterized protein LOC111696848 isoform X2 n=1 Tax=Eurytemora carolleeae TaxID=1294199 RepID=UPI000C7705E3|nr:uncharacterized protein LOC111696848 isoform X2 [Eurytemora carolleeae]|eukprot:XP_023322364.1 uncharacterized protein LOC111696848 isoform X2 [Eurytemora affinis]